MCYELRASDVLAHWQELSALRTRDFFEAKSRLCAKNDDPAILNIPIAGGEAKILATVGFPFTGTVSPWFGLDPADAPLMLRDVSTNDVYALTLEEK